MEAASSQPRPPWDVIDYIVYYAILQTMYRPENEYPRGKAKIYSS
jgi:hypothetical protein